MRCHVSRIAVTASQDAGETSRLELRRKSDRGEPTLMPESASEAGLRPGRAEVAVGSAIPDRNPLSMAESDSLPSGPRSIVIVDDDVEDIELLEHYLRQVEGAETEVVSATSTDAARGLLAQRPLATVFLDYRLGSDSGEVLLKELGALGHRGPVIVATGYGNEYVVAELLRAGADDYIAKRDLSPELLRRALRTAESQWIGRRTKQRNAELVAELEDAKRALEAKNQRLAELYRTAQQFVDHVSHEFRTPLTVVKEFAGIIRDGLAGPVSPEQREYIDIILDRTDDLATMIDDMLDISKLETGLLGVCRRECRVADIVERVRPALERKAASTKVHLAIADATDLPPVYCDSEKASRVLINLTINALKFCSEGGNVRVAFKVDSEAHCVQVMVTDDGAGIAPRDVEVIFERFRQLDGHVRSSTKGFGLGLNIVRELVKLNYGEVSVRSELNRGSEFAFTLPIAEPVHVLAAYLRRYQAYPLLLVSATAANGNADELAQLDLFLRRHVRESDLVLRGGNAAWNILAACPESDESSFVGRIQHALEELNRNRPTGRLPELRLEVRGAWPLASRRQDLPSQVKRELRWQACGSPAEHWLEPWTQDGAEDRIPIAQECAS